MAEAQPKVDSRHYREVLGHYPTGVSIVTAVAADGTPAGMVVGTFTSVSLDPPLVAFLPDKASTSWPKIRSSGRFCANVLSYEQEHLSRKFAMSGGNKFEDVSWRPSENGSPILDGVLAWIDCSIEQTFESGDHYIVVGRVHDLAVERRSAPLAFYQGAFGQVALGESDTEPAGDHTEDHTDVARRTAALFDYYDGSSREAAVRDLAGAHGVDDADLKRWYSSKNEIVDGLVMDYLDDLIERYRTVETESSPEEQFARLVRLSFESIDHHKAAIIVFQNERGGFSDATSEQLRHSERVIMGTWTKVLTTGIEAGAFSDKVDPVLTYRLVRDAIFMVARWWRPDGPLKPSDLADDYTELLLNGLRHRGS